MLMPEFCLISQSVPQDRVQLPKTGVNRLERTLRRVAEAERVAELPVGQAQKTFDRIEETLYSRVPPLREYLKAAIRTEVAPFNACQRLGLAAEFLQVFARLRPFIEGSQLIISERTPEFDGLDLRGGSSTIAASRVGVRRRFAKCALISAFHSGITARFSPCDLFTAQSNHRINLRRPPRWYEACQ